jgi:membrane protein
MARFRRRDPDNPTDLNKRSWLSTLKRTGKEFSHDNLTDWAAALTYYAVLSLFPALIALISILGLVVDPQTITRVITDVVSQLGPKSAVDTFKGPIDQIAGNRSGALLGLIIGIAAALWTASGYVGAFMRASNSMYEREEGRPFYILRPLQILVTFVLVMMAALVVLSLVVSGPVASAIGSAVGLGDTAVTVWNIAKWPVLLVVVMAMLAILYWPAPNARQKNFRWVSPGAIVAVIVWIVASAAFAFYVANFGSYNKTYGALGGVIVFLVWMWITNLAVLFGAELNAEIERSREIEAGVPGAEEDIKAPYRRTPKGEREPAETG